MVSTRSRTASGGQDAPAPAAAPQKRAASATTSPRPAKKKAAALEFAVGKSVVKDVTLRNQKEEDVAFSATYKDQGVVIFMYPKANTPGCTKQACGFRDNIQTIKDSGFSVYGLSGDAPKALANWQDKQSLPFDLLSDPQHELIKYFGSSVGGSKVQRSHVVILKGGVVGDIQPKVSPAESVQRAVDFVKTHASGGDSKPEAAAAAPAASVASAADGLAGLTVGEKLALDVELETDVSAKVKLQDLIKTRGAIFFMYPKADTPGCTKQACGFNDNLEEINAAGFDVFGLGADTPAELAAWKAKQSYKYSFLSDPEHKVIGFFGSVTEAKRVERSHVIVLPGGEVGQIEHNVSPQDSFTKALAFVKAHATES